MKGDIMALKDFVSWGSASPISGCSNNSSCSSCGASNNSYDYSEEPIESLEPEFTEEPEFLEEPEYVEGPTSSCGSPGPNTPCS